MLKFLKNDLTIEVAKKLLLRLLLIDFIFIIIHITVCLVYYLGYIEDFGEYNFLVLTQDESYAEMFQYLKYIAFIVMTIYLISIEKSYAYISWVLLFLFFLLDDSLSLHELAGELLAEKYNFEPKFGLRAVDFGELGFVAVMGSIILFTMGIAYFRGGDSFKKRTHRLLFLLAFLVLFGVGFDMLHEMLGENLIVGFVIGLIEDGGEMLIVTLMVCYIYQLIKPVDTYRFNIIEVFNFNKSKSKNS